MITKEELQNLLTTTEAYRVERTISTTDKDKFGEAVCAFANDMPDTGKPGSRRLDDSMNPINLKKALIQKVA